ncbi:hypothetical protein M8332_00560 [Fructilactobacillus ixorae]|uniref:Beta-1,6-galactofuranosyltransferase n=1 Tax=Fructilactobacillus ixorae TaxID=1750535 RepID=A0ABY5C3N0_9LACO|nr:hypothetical protein [Fructilactobacillus ixorae]USS93394.1 hypothetical protein M8332_00560 [Fructilactobacillus ixorae]
MSRYIINMVRADGSSGDNKPKADAGRILADRLAFQPVNIKQYKHSRIDQNWLIHSRIKHKLGPLHLTADDVVLVHYPIYTGAKFETYLLEYLQKHGVTTIALVHDLDSLRFNWSIFGDLQNEVNYLNGYDFVIAHNPKMTELLRQTGLTTKVVNLRIFDYLAKRNEVANSSQTKNQVTFAGNLNKAPFLINLQVHNPVKFELYGNIDDASQLNPSLHYHGSVSPTQLAKEMGRGFGLVWDGTSVNGVTGSVGNYLRYNNPYKLSAYLSADMPVIVWEKAAISDFVNRHQIGISVARIDDLTDVLSQLDDAKFQQMVANAQSIGAKVRNGDYLYAAVKQCLKPN